MKKFIAIILVALLAIPLGIMFTSATENNIARGKDYLFTGKYTDNDEVVLYPDTDNSELTDGVSGTAEQWGYTKAIWVGLNWKGENAVCEDTTWSDTTLAYNDVVVDLGTVEASASLHLLRFLCLITTQTSQA